MRIFRKPVSTASLILILIGVYLLSLSIISEGSLNVALPLVFLMLGGAFFILMFAARDRWPLASFLFIPGSLLLTFGLIFLINILTNDWNAWAYAWMLLLAGLGVGIILTCRQYTLPQAVLLTGWGLAILGITLFALFGAIVGGLFIQMMAPILIILGGLALRWLRIETILPAPLLQRLRIAPLPAADAPKSLNQGQSQLLEPLSAREIEVLRLVDQGLSNQQIAQKLNVANSTVKTHINNIYGKLEVQTRVQALNRARDLGLLDS